MKLIIADTGPILHLEEAGVADFLPRLGEVHVTPCVLGELQRRGGWTRPAWLQVDQPSAKALREARAWTSSGLLHAGEAEALAHAKELHELPAPPAAGRRIVFVGDLASGWHVSA